MPESFDCVHDNAFYLTHENMNNEIPFKIFKFQGRQHQHLHSHEYMQMWYVLHGSCVHTLKEFQYEYKRFGLFIIPPYAKHKIEVDDPETVMICCEFSERFINESLINEDRNSLFDFAYLEPFFLYENLIDIAFTISKDQELIVENLILELLDQYNNKNKYSNLFIKADLLKLLAIIASEYERGITREKDLLITKYHNAIDQALAYMEENCSGKLYLEDVCKISLMSHSTFSYIFKQVTGKTFSEYVMSLRISKACELLKSTNKSIMDICQNCGFSDSTYFCRAFKKAIGMPPTSYRKSSRLTKADD